MKTAAGLWIDHRKAIIVTLSDKGQETKEILSSVEKQLGRSDGKHSTASFESQLVKPDDKQQRGFTKSLKVFYEEVLANIKDAEAILIFGPGEAKGELQKLIEQNNLHGKVVVVESADKMTDGQVAARVKAHFANELKSKKEIKLMERT
jgi:stalled ribosome rescue protein Dom34